MGTSSGLTTYGDTQVTSSYTGSSASSTGVVVISAATWATATAVSASRTASSSVSTTPEAKPQAPPWIDPDGEAEVLGVGGALEHAVADAEALVADPLEPEVGVGGAELGRPGEGGVAEAR